MNNKEFSRQPRFLPEMPDGTKEIQDPPSKPSKAESSVILMILPPLVMLAVTVIMAMLSKSLYMIISLAMTLTTVFTSIAADASRKRKYKKDVKKRKEKYLSYINDIRTELTLAKNAQIAAVNETNPLPEECMARIRRIDSKLWERTVAHNDFLSVRLGVGSVPFAINVKYDTRTSIMEEDELKLEPAKLAKEFERINSVPVCLDVFGSEISGLAGEADKVSYLLQLMLLQIITNHGYDDVKLVLLVDENNLQSRQWIRFAPHVWSDDKKSRYVLCGKAMAHKGLSSLYDTIKERELAQKDDNAPMAKTLPHYVFVVEDASLLENEAIAKYLYNPNKALGVSAVFVAPNKAYLPTNCKKVVAVNGKMCEISDKETGEKSTFTPDSVNLSELEWAARRLASIQLKNSASGFALPSSITLNETYGIKKAQDVDLISNWQNNKPYKGMKVPIGARAGKELFCLDMHEKGYGPHGLVAGTTGSGKSELLQTIIISLAMNYHPHDIAFVLIDYKGGGMADVFKGMPHRSGTITNLGGNQTTRALISIKSEIQRRQVVFSQYGVNNIDKYQKLYHSGLAKEPVPHLIMIADEFAELKAEQPDFMKELVSAARVGRSLGIHLILATQKPAGVVDDQIWSNSKFKICLKVQDGADSRDVIKRTDAAMIKEPGRAYIQVGNDEVFEMFQSSYSGAPETNGGVNKANNSVYKIALDGSSEKIYPLYEQAEETGKVKSQLEAMVEHIINTAKANSIQPLEGPWTEPLAETLSLDEVLEKEDCVNLENGLYPKKNNYCITAGIADNPACQRKEKLTFDFVKDGNLFIYGSSGSGKTNMVKSLCMSMALTNSPDEVNMYLMDFGGTSLRRLEALPHVGGVMTIEQQDRLNQFMLFMLRTVEARKNMFTDARCDNFEQFKSKNPAVKCPAIFVFVDNYYALSESYEDIDDKMMVLAREGNKFGIYLIATAVNSTLVRYRFSINFKMAATFCLTDASEYSNIVGRTDGLEPQDNPGRGLWKSASPLEFQCALPQYGTMSYEELMEKFCNLAESGKLSIAQKIPQMPEKVDIFAINGDDTEGINVGICDKDMQSANVDLMTNHVFLITGESGMGKSTVMMSMIDLMLSKGAKVYARDSMSMGIYPVFNKPNVVDLGDEGKLYSVIEEITAELDSRRATLNELKKNGGNTAELVDGWQQIVIAIDDIVDAAEDMSYELKTLLTRIAKKDAGLKVCLLGTGETESVYCDYDEAVKPFKEAQCGILLGSLKDQNLFNVRQNYGEYEKERELCDGYLILKSKYASIRSAVDFALI